VVPEASKNPFCHIKVCGDNSLLKVISKYTEGYGEQYPSKAIREAKKCSA